MSRPTSAAGDKGHALPANPATPKSSRLRRPKGFPLWLEIVSFCAHECERQRSGELSVFWMAEAYAYARKNAFRAPLFLDVLELGHLTEPLVNAHGTRRVGVRVGWDVKMDWQTVEPALRHLMDNPIALSPEDFFQEYETIHPFRDGNGRTGAILYNWLKGTLGNPVTAPEYVSALEQI